MGPTFFAIAGFDIFEDGQASSSHQIRAHWLPWL